MVRFHRSFKRKDRIAAAVFIVFAGNKETLGEICTLKLVPVARMRKTQLVSLDGRYLTDLNWNRLLRA